MSKRLLSLVLCLALCLSLMPAALAAEAEEPTEKLSVTVSFLPGTGTGSMAPVTVSAGEEYTLPACTFTHTNSERAFYKWSVGGELKNPGDAITVSADTAVTAMWVSTASGTMINNSKDLSTTNYVGIIVMTDTRTGDTTTEELFNETAGSSYEYPQNSAVSALSGRCVSTLMTAAHRYPNAKNISDDKPALDADHAEIVDSWNHITFRYEESTDDVGDYFRTMYMEGDCGRAWRFTETVTGEYTSPEPIESVSMVFTPPAVGTTITVTDWKSDIKPVLTLPEGETRCFAYGGYPEWELDEGDDGEKTFTIEAGQTYRLFMELKPEDGYCFDDSTAVSAENAAVESVHVYGDGIMGIILSFTAQGEDPTPSSSFFGVLISDAEGIVNKGGSYILDYAENPFGGAPRTTATNNFVADGAHVCITALPDEGYRFAGWYQGEPNRPAGEPVYSGDPISGDDTFEFDAPLAMELPYLCAVFEKIPAAAHPADQVQMWVGNTKVVGPNSSAQGGKVAVKYTPSWDDYPDIVARDGTDFVAGDILQFYKGDECTVYARADEGYRFVGWYHVNIEWAPGETLAWEGSVISTAGSFTYKPGVTILTGDSEPLRYVCAVFEETPAVTLTAPTITSISNTPEGIQLTWNAVPGAAKYAVFRRTVGGGTWQKYTVTAGTTFVDKKAVGGSRYSYALRCVNAAGAYVSPQGAERILTRYPLAAPLMQTIARTDAGLKIAWSAVEGAPAYAVYRKVNGESTWHKHTVRTGTSYVDTHVENGVMYTYTVRCQGTDGAYLSQYVSTKTMTFYSLAAPAITSVSQTAAGVKITWGAVNGATRYAVWRSVNGGAWAKYTVTAATSFVDKKAAAGNTYAYTIRCVDASGTYVSSYDSAGRTITVK